MKLLFIGYAVNTNTASNLSGVSIAGNKMQVNVIKELHKRLKDNLDVISIYPIASFPHDKQVFVKKDKLELFDGCITHRVAFTNLPLIKQISQINSVYREAKKLIDKDTVVFTFNMFPQVGLPAISLKKKYGVKVCSLLADLPIDDNTVSKSKVRKFFRGIFDRYTEKAIKSADKLFVLNEQAAKDFAPGIPYIVIEGGVEKDKIQPLENDITRKRSLVYGGALTEYSGVLQLIEAMRLVNDKSITLDIYGGGYLEKQIPDMIANDSNICYHGRVSNEEMLKIQRSAYALINPRPATDRISQLTFPSKMFEYMTSGTPVISTKLNGLNKDFSRYLHLTDDNTPEAIAKAINDFIASDYDASLQKARQAFDFIVNEKNWDIQTRKMLDFISKE